MSSYPSINDSEFDLLKKLVLNSASISDAEAGDVASVAGTSGAVLVNGGTAAATGAVTISLPATLTTVTGIAPTAANTSITLTPSGTGVLWAGASTALGRPTGSGLIVLQNGSLGTSSQGGLEFQYATSGSGYGGRIGTDSASDSLFLDTRFNSATWVHRIQVDATANGSITLTPNGTGGLVVAAAKMWLNNSFAANTYVLNSTGTNLVVNSPAGFIAFSSGNGANLEQIMSNGHHLLGGLTTDGTGVLQFPAATTTAGGITFGTDSFIYRTAANTLAIGTTSTSTTQIVSGTNAINFYFYENSTTLTAAINSNGGSVGVKSVTGSLALYSNNTVALTLDTSQNGTLAGTQFQIGGNRIRVPSDGVFTITNAANTDFTRLQFGGTTSSFPALKRNSANIDVVSADDSVFSGMRMATLTLTSGTNMVSSTTSFAAGATGNVPTLTAGPVTGNPTKWIAINDNGTTRYIPTW